MLHLLLACGLLLLARSAPAAEPLDTAATTFLSGYEQIRLALANDQLPAARDAAKALPEAKAIAEAKSISEARKAFKALSTRAVTLARGQPGYFIAHCTMFPGGADWVQTTDAISNPYWGKSMPHCGEIVK
ncbi:MAG: DUF3347 domain-containing protein [Opitutaceae bacterium]|nr:DUF3347 domain-containing protein [Opitutaceae bacterium]